MTFKASNKELSVAYHLLKEKILNIQQVADQAANRMTGTVTGDEILSLGVSLERLDSQVTALQQTSGIAKYAKDQENDQTYDVVAEYQAVQTALDAVQNEIRTTFPVDGNGYLLNRKFNSANSIQTTSRNFAPAATTDIKTLCETLSATIE